MNIPQSFLELLKIDVDRYPVIAVVGGGGKTSLIFRLTRELREKGKTVIVSTTTRMDYEPLRPFAPDGNTEKVRKDLKEYGYTIAAHKNEDSKISGLTEEKLMELKEICDVMLIEADGAKHLPIKVPAEWEPVIPQFADLVISVVGLDSLGKPIRKTAHRMERTADFLRKSMDAPITSEDIVKIASSICGLLKNVEDRVYRVYLNKADVLEEQETAEEILEELEQRQIIASFGSIEFPGTIQDDVHAPGNFITEEADA